MDADQVQDLIGELDPSLRKSVVEEGIGRRNLAEQSDLSKWEARHVVKRLREMGEDVEHAPWIEGVKSGEDPDVEQVYNYHAQLYERKAEKVQQRRNQRIVFEDGPIAIAFVGDQHIGNSGTDIERVFEEADIIRDTPRMFCWQMGDVVDNYVVGRLRKLNMQASVSIRGQWDLAKEYMEVFDERLIAVLGGNHGAWSLKQVGVDQRKDIVPDGILWDSDEILATVSVGGAEYRVKARHKWPGSSIYNPSHGMERSAKFDDADFDLFAGGHDHKGAMVREFVQGGERKAAILTGTYKTVDDYYKEGGWPANDGSTTCALVLHEDGSYFGGSDLEAISRYMQEVA